MSSDKEKSQSASIRAAKIFRNVICVFLCLLSLFPFYVMLVNATRTSVEIQTHFSLIPSGSFLENYNKPMDYAGDFIDVFGGYGLGADHGWSPEGEYATAPQSFSFTFSKGLGFGIGKDTYSDPIPIFKWGGN